MLVLLTENFAIEYSKWNWARTKIRWGWGETLREFQIVLNIVKFLFASPCCLRRQCKSDKLQMGQKIPLLHILLYQSVRISNAMRSTLTHTHTHTHTLTACISVDDLFAFYGASGMEHAEHSLAVWPDSRGLPKMDTSKSNSKTKKQNNK